MVTVTNTCNIKLQMLLCLESSYSRRRLAGDAEIDHPGVVDQAGGRDRFPSFGKPMHRVKMSDISLERVLGRLSSILPESTEVYK